MPELAISKVANPVPATSGAELQYTIDVTNNGSSTATGVIVTDDLPDRHRVPERDGSRRFRLVRRGPARHGHLQLG